MNHVRFMISPELYVVQETLEFDILEEALKSISFNPFSLESFRD
jgi:hypothetical protein